MSAEDSPHRRSTDGRTVMLNKSAVHVTAVCSAFVFVGGIIWHASGVYSRLGYLENTTQVQYSKIEQLERLQNQQSDTVKVLELTLKSQVDLIAVKLDGFKVRLDQLIEEIRRKP